MKRIIFPAFAAILLSGCVTTQCVDYASCQQAEREQEQANRFWSAFAAGAAAQQAAQANQPQPVYQQRQTTNCRTYKLGNAWHTDCQ